MQAIWCHSFLWFLLGRRAYAVQSAVSAGLEDQQNKYDIVAPVEALQDAVAGEKSLQAEVSAQRTKLGDDKNNEIHKSVNLAQGTAQKTHVDEASHGVSHGNTQRRHRGYGDARGRDWGGYYYGYYSRQPSLLQSGQIPYLQQHAKLVNEHPLSEEGYFQTAQEPKNEKWPEGGNILPGMRPVGFWGEGWLEIPQGRFNAIGFGWYYYNGRPVYGLNRRGTGRLPRKHGFVPWWRPPYASAHGMPRRYWSWLANRGVAHHTPETDEKVVEKARKFVKEAEKAKEAIQTIQNATNKIQSDVQKSRVDKLKKILGV